HDHMLRALVRLGEAHPDAALLVLNKDYPGEREHRQELERRIGELGLAGRVRIMGFRQDVHELMGAVDIGVIPSLASETNCRVAVEFFAAGTPVVAYPTGALPEVVEHGVSGLVTPAGAPEHLAAALESILGDRALLERLGRGARQSAGERFSRERFLEQTLAVYHRALAACHRAPGAP
ncbi:MAG: glycosyltransferase family 4 protein, partial [Deltaproteobacteria bacterium]|nr:glycosyltransferase family 4 protein [Deltaproteobacteria bacterium]